MARNRIDTEKLKELVGKGFTDRQIARLLKTTPQKIASMRHYYGLPCNRAIRKHKPTAPTLPKIGGVTICPPRYVDGMSHYTARPKQ